MVQGGRPGSKEKSSQDKKKTSLRFLSLNARSVMNKLDLLQATVLDLNPDVIGVTESWANENISDAELKLNGYELFRCDRKTRHRGGGVLLYVKDVLNPAEFHTKSEYGEHAWCKVKDLLIGLCYRSDNAAIVGQENELQLRQLLQEVCGSHVLIMGDFNYPDVD